MIFCGDVTDLTAVFRLMVKNLLKTTSYRTFAGGDHPDEALLTGS